VANEGKWPEDELMCQYVEVGDWARHYSNVRATVAPVLAALSLGILQFAIEKSGALKFIPAVSSALLWATALFILVWFTRATRHATRHWVYIQGLLFPDAPESDKYKVFLHDSDDSLKKWDGRGLDLDLPAKIGLGLTTIYALFFLVWVF
jgi:hypothetical protein